MKPAKPLPKPTAETLPFWQAAAQGKLFFQRCSACARAQFPPARHCPACGNRALQWQESAANGSIHSHTTVHRAPTAAFKEDVPYVIALIDLDEGFRMMMNWRGSDPASARIGDRVRVVFEANASPWPLPQAIPDPGE
jgi:uncharacterized OB-fold protein